MGGTHVPKKTEVPSILVCGPPVTAEQYENSDAMKSAPLDRISLIKEIDGIKIKLNGCDKNCIKLTMDTLTEEEKAGHDFILEKLHAYLKKFSSSKHLVNEEKLYLGTFLSKVRDIVGKITTLSVSRAIMAGTYIYRDHPKSSGGYRGGFRGRGGGFSRSRGGFNSKFRGGRRGGSSFRGRGGGDNRYRP